MFFCFTVRMIRLVECQNVCVVCTNICVNVLWHRQLPMLPSRFENGGVQYPVSFYQHASFPSSLSGVF